MNFIDLAEKRRSIYALGKNMPCKDTETAELIKTAIRLSPTAFNNQSVRAAILFGDKHDKLWDIVVETLRPIAANAEAWAKTSEKIASFKAAYGSVLFFTDAAVVKEYEAKFPPFAANFHDWAEQGLGIANYTVWAALAEKNIGASLQHYNPLIDGKVRETFGIAPNWELRAQMPFGSIEGKPAEKTFIGDDIRFKE